MKWLIIIIINFYGAIFPGTVSCIKIQEQKVKIYKTYPERGLPLWEARGGDGGPPQTIPVLYTKQVNILPNSKNLRLRSYCFYKYIKYPPQASAPPLLPISATLLIWS